MKDFVNKAVRNRGNDKKAAHLILTMHIKLLGIGKFISQIRRRGSH